MIDGLRDLNGAVTLRDIMDGGIMLEYAVIEAINKNRKEQNRRAVKSEGQSIINKMKGR